MPYIIAWEDKQSHKKMCFQTFSNPDSTADFACCGSDCAAWAWVIRHKNLGCCGLLMTKAGEVLVSTAPEMMEDEE